ncbi:MAG: protamine-2 (modular protein) [Rhizobiales bacterium]|nr:protamine-2 (modular protein) [Hyphomicrobiales bacterium]
MDRRLFLTGLFGIAGAAALAGVARPDQAIAGVPNARGILDELDAPMPDVLADDEGVPEVELIRHRRWHRRRRRVRRRVCQRYWRHGRWRRRCFTRWYWV